MTRAAPILCLLAASSAFAADKLSFNRDIRPILSENCFACHDAKKKSGKYDMTTFEKLMAGGPDGPVGVGHCGPIKMHTVWDGVPVQRCTVHKHRNLLAHAPKSLHDELTEDYHDMVYAETKAEIEARRGVLEEKAAPDAEVK